MIRASRLRGQAEVIEPHAFCGHRAGGPDVCVGISHLRSSTGAAQSKYEIRAVRMSGGQWPNTSVPMVTAINPAPSLLTLRLCKNTKG